MIGKKIRGFRFNDEEYPCGYASNMDDLIGRVGIIVSFVPELEAYEIQFKGEVVAWSYPAELVKQHLCNSEASYNELKDFINRISGEMLRNDFVLSEKWYEQAQDLLNK